MKRVSFIILLLAGSARGQQEAAIFQPPVPYDVQRYEAGWNKNPFTLKTVAPVVKSVSFAMDLAIGTYYGDSADPTIIIVNTKTNERISLKRDRPAANGMNLRSVKLGSSRKDLVVEVTLGTETAAIRYNDSYVKQIAGAEMTKAPATQQSRPQPETAPKIQFPQDRSQSKVSTAGIAPSTAQAGPTKPGRPGFVPPSGTRNAVNPPPSPPLVSQSSDVNGALPVVPVRRRLIGPVINIPAVSQ